MARTKTTTNTESGSTDAPTETKKPRSEKRQRNTQVIGVRIGEEEADLLAHARVRAKKLGAVLPESTGGFLRWLAMNSASEIVGETVVPTRTPPASQRAPSIDNVAVARLMGEVGRLGNNTNQIAKRMHQTGDVPSAETAIELTAAINRLSLSVAMLGGVRVDGSDDEDEAEAEAFFDPPAPTPRTQKTTPPETTPARAKSVSGWRATTKTGGAS